MKLAQKRKEREQKSEYFRIAFDPTREKMIEEYLNSVEDKPPSFLIPLHEYHKRLKVNHPSLEEPTDTFTGVNIPEDEDLESTLKTVPMRFNYF